MPVTDPWSLSRTAASNTTIGGVSAAEGILPANLNNIDRALGAGLAEFVYVLCGGITSGGTADAQTITTGLSWASYAAGKGGAFKAGYTNTTTMTVNVDGLGTKTAQDNQGNALPAGAVTTDGIYMWAYDADNDVIRILNPSSSSASSVTAANTITDNAVVRGDGGSRGVQQTGVTVDDSNNVSGIAGLSATTIDLGNADTTLARVGAGDVTIEGNAVYRAGGTDVPVTDGGTGVSSLTAYAVMCGGTTSTAAVQSIAGVGTSGQVLTSNGAGALPTFQSSAGGFSMPVGAIIDYGGSSAPALWLLCYGQNVSRTTYADLFTAIGTTFGAGDGSTTFAIPDLRGRVTAGKDDMGGTAANRITAGNSGITGTTLGAAGGDERMQSHTHLAYGTTSGGGTAQSLNAGKGQDQNVSATTSTTGAGSSQNVQPTMIVNKIIYAGV